MFNLFFKERIGNERGFTLIELMIVVVIIGVLAAVAVPTFMGQAEKSKESAVKTDLQSMKSAIDVYAATYGIYPHTDVSRVYEALDMGQMDWAAVKDPWGYSYKYGSSSGQDYLLGSKGKDSWGSNDYYVTHNKSVQEGNGPSSPSLTIKSGGKEW